MTPAELELLTERLLEEGVPTSVVGRSLGLDPELVKAKLAQVRVKRYGTEDMDEYYEQLQWDAIDSARHTIETGSATERARVLGVVLGKQIAIAGRRKPQAVRNATDELLDRLREMRDDTAPDKERSTFVVSAGDA